MSSSEISEEVLRIFAAYDWRYSLRDLIFDLEALEAKIDLQTELEWLPLEDWEAPEIGWTMEDWQPLQSNREFTEADKT